MKQKQNNNINNKSGNITQGSRNVNIAHFDAKGLIYLWFFSFLFLLLLFIFGFAFLQYQIGQFA